MLILRKHTLLICFALCGALTNKAATTDEACTDRTDEALSDSTSEVCNGNTEDFKMMADSVLQSNLFCLYHSAMAPLDLSEDEDMQIYSLPDSLKIHDLSAKPIPVSPYALPYSFTGQTKDWHRLWINTAVLSGAFVGTLFVLECLPEDATTWNRAEIRQTPMFTRWYQNVFVKGPEWDHDKWVFNYLLHPYAGSVYFMTARSCGFNFWQSLLYSSIISDVGWEFGIEAFMERPSYQDMFITPLVGSAIGECCYMLKRHIVDNGYRLFGSPVLGNIVAFLVDPVNEVVGLFNHNPARAVAHEKREEQGTSLSFAPMLSSEYKGFTLDVTF